MVFSNPRAYADIYGMKSNVQRSPIYTVLKRKSNDNNTLNTVDVAEHAQKRKLLNLCFTEKSLRAAAGFIVKHVDRWNELMLKENSNATEWSAPVDFAPMLDNLVFDIIGDLSLGKSFDIKEPGDNPLRVMPHNAAEYMGFYYLVGVSNSTFRPDPTDFTVATLTGPTVLTLSFHQTSHLAEASRSRSPF